MTVPPMTPVAVAPMIVERERTHRRLIAAATVILLGISLGPVVGHHVPNPVSAALAGRDHLWSLCMVALHALAAPVHQVFHLLLAGGVAYAAIDRTRAVLRLRAALQSLMAHQVAPSSHVVAACEAASVDLRHIRVIAHASTPAFTAGLLHPCIYISDALSQRLAVPQLAAVLAHEEAHRRRRDPLRASSWRFLGCTLFFIPVIRHLGQDMMDEVEITADDEALQCCAIQPIDLAAALVDVSASMRADPAIAGASVGFHRDALLERRVKRLVGEPAAPASHMTRRSLTAATFALSALWASGLIVAHPLPTPAAHEGRTAQTSTVPTSHCEHGTWWVFSHLWCSREAAAAASTHTGASGVPCSHR